MRGIQISDMEVRGRAGGMTRIHVDASDFNRAMKTAQQDIADAMFKGSGAAFAYAKQLTDNYLRSQSATTGQAKKVADSLQYDQREQRVVTITGDNVTVEAMFGSRGPDIRGQIGVGVHTSPDDNGNRFNIGQAVQEGISAGYFSWRSSGAQEHSRQVGRKGSATPWYAGKGSGTAYFFGITGLDYLGFAEDVFSRVLESKVQREMKKRFE